MKNKIIWFSVFIIILALILGLTLGPEKFTSLPNSHNGIGKYTPDADKTAWFRTFGRECEPGLTKCEGDNFQYFCSAKKNCQIDKYNLKGKPIKEPMSWFERHV